MKFSLSHNTLSEILKFSQKLLDGYSISEIYHNDLIETNNTLLFWKDYNSRLLYYNNKFAEVTGITRLKEAIGRIDCGLPLSKELIDSYVADDYAVISTQSPKINIIEPLMNIDGKDLALLTGKFPFFSSDRRKVGVIGISTLIISSQHKDI